METLNRDRLWQQFMRLGEAAGCHQMPERSFFIGEYQFPLCARCTGVLIGKLAAYILLIFRRVISLPFSAAMLLVMGADWFIQKIGLRESNNIRRLITGILGGIGITFIFVNILLKIIKKNDP